MKLLRFAPAFLLFACCIARADDDQKQEQPPEEIPDFSNLDEYVYVPKTTLNFGTRFLEGPKTSFHGHGQIPSPTDPGSDPTIANIDRTYYDGRVSPDSRSTTVDNGNGTSTTVPVGSDGKTDTWSYDYASQSTTAPGYIQFHTYSGEVVDNSTFTNRGDGNMGIELVANHEMGNVGSSKKITWALTAGFAINDLRSASQHNVLANITTVTDTYDLYGEVAPTAPYSGPGGGSTTQNIVNSSGDDVDDSSGTAETTTVINPILLGNVPLERDSSGAVATSTEVQNRFDIEGAYYTLRVGPSIVVPFGKHWKLTGSLGGVMVYAGDTFTAEEIFTPEFADGTTGTPIDVTYTKNNTRVLPGYYADLDLQYNLTDTAGFYAGGVFQSAGSFNQSVPSGGTDAYGAKIDLSNQSGVRAGMTVKF